MTSSYIAHPASSARSKSRRKRRGAIANENGHRRAKKVSRTRKLTKCERNKLTKSLVRIEDLIFEMIPPISSGNIYDLRQVRTKVIASTISQHMDDISDKLAENDFSGTAKAVKASKAFLDQVDLRQLPQKGINFINKITGELTRLSLELKI